jgi:hypothetical protein
MSHTASESLLSKPHICRNVGFGVEVATGVGVVPEFATGVTAAVGFAVALIATPLFQTSFVPDLTQVNFFPPEIEVTPAFEHELPAFTAAIAEVALKISVPTISVAIGLITSTHA